MSENEKPLINIDLGDLGDVANTLVEKICTGVGILYKPRAIIKEAEALAKAKLIAAQADIDINQIQARALIGLINQEERKQLNRDKIIAGALDNIESTATPDDISDDWLNFFFDRSSHVSDEEMQFIWSNLLASEANKAGSYSKRTIEFIATMSKYEALKFTDVCQFIVQIHDCRFIIISDLNNSTEIGSTLTFSDYINFESLGLININKSANYRAHKLPQAVKGTYFDHDIDISLSSEHQDKDGTYNIPLGIAVLTSLGYELSSLCKPNKNEFFLKFLKNYWSAKNITIEIA